MLLLNLIEIKIRPTFMKSLCCTYVEYESKTQPDDLPENARNCKFLAVGAAYKRQNPQSIPAQSSLERVLVHHTSSALKKFKKKPSIILNSHA